MRYLFKQESFGDYTVRKATVNDTEEVLSILRGAADWLHGQGIRQWGYLRNGGEDAEIKQGILDGTTYIAEKSGEIAATFNLSDQQNDWDVEIWGERNDPALYLHRLAVSKEFRGQHLGKGLLLWMGENLKGEGSLLRLDCVAENRVLNEFYEKAGFRLVGQPGEGEDRFSAYEKAFQTRS